MTVAASAKKTVGGDSRLRTALAAPEPHRHGLDLKFRAVAAAAANRSESARQQSAVDPRERATAHGDAYHGSAAVRRRDAIDLIKKSLNHRQLMHVSILGLESTASIHRKIDLDQRWAARSLA
jgi:hypothetical protein